MYRDPSEIYHQEERKGNLLCELTQALWRSFENCFCAICRLAVFKNLCDHVVVFIYSDLFRDVSDVDVSSAIIFASRRRKEN